MATTIVPGPVFFTYNWIAIAADSLVHDPKAHTVEATGHVIFQDGTSASQASKAVVTLTGLHPTARLTE